MEKVKNQYGLEMTEAGKEIEAELNGFNGTENYYKASFIGGLKVTDGIEYLRQKAGAFWLIDIVSSVQGKAIIRQAKSFIVWRILVNTRKEFIVTAWTDTPEGEGSQLLFKQFGGYTDFPLACFEFYQCEDVVLLKSEY